MQIQRDHFKRFDFKILLIDIVDYEKLWRSFIWWLHCQQCHLVLNPKLGHDVIKAESWRVDIKLTAFWKIDNNRFNCWVVTTIQICMYGTMHIYSQYCIVGRISSPCVVRDSTWLGLLILLSVSADLDNMYTYNHEFNRISSFVQWVMDGEIDVQPHCILA